MNNQRLKICLFIITFVTVAALFTVHLQPQHNIFSFKGTSNYSGYIAEASIDKWIQNTSVHSNPIVHYINQQLQKVENRSATNENMLKCYFMFDRKNIYQLGMDTESPKRSIDSRKDLSEELTSVILFGLTSLNKGSEKMKIYPTYDFTEADFLYGLLRVEMGIGIHYKLVFKPHFDKAILNKPKLFRLTLFRPFAPLYSLQTSFSEEDETIYFIVPLHERLNAFKVFIKVFENFAVPDKNVHLTVVYYVSSDLIEVIQTLQLLENSTGFGNYKLVKIVNETFARGRARDYGVRSIDDDVGSSQSNPLVFFCDVDVAFTAEFLNECRVHSTAGRSVFYPIVFSLYNPEVVYGKSSIPSPIKQRQHLNKKGFWRSFGYGMSCQHLSDYKSIGGFDLTIIGWGFEDVKLFRKFVQSNIHVVRTPVDSLFHHWHEKLCNTSLAEQYSSCLSSRALTEGSSKDLGLKYFELKEKLESLQKERTKT